MKHLKDNIMVHFETHHTKTNTEKQSNTTN